LLMTISQAQSDVPPNLAAKPNGAKDGARFLVRRD
jgi:hypothetical protein